MSFTRETLYLVLRPTMVHSALLIFVHVIALAAVVVSSVWSVAQAIVLLLAIVISGVYRVYRFGLLRHPASIIGVNYDRGNWRLSLRKGEVLDVALLSPIVVSRWFIVLNFKTGRAGTSLNIGSASGLFFKSISGLFSIPRSRLFATGGSRLFSASGSRLFATSGSRLSVVIANDSLDRDTLRRSRVFFRFALTE